MRANLILLLLLIPFIGFSQNENYSISGTTMFVSHYQGGMENPFEPQPFPKGGIELIIVRLESGKKSKKVCSLISGSDGSFNIELPPGEYGFVLKEDLRKMSIGQFLPKGYSTGDMMESTSSSWSINNNVPIVIIDKDVDGVIITNYEYTVCGMCP